MMGEEGEEGGGWLLALCGMIRVSSPPPHALAHHEPIPAIPQQPSSLSPLPTSALLHQRQGFTRHHPDHRGLTQIMALASPPFPTPAPPAILSCPVPRLARPNATRLLSATLRDDHMGPRLASCPYPAAFAQTNCCMPTQQPCTHAHTESYFLLMFLLLLPPTTRHVTRLKTGVVVAAADAEKLLLLADRLLALLENRETLLELDLGDLLLVDSVGAVGVAESADSGPEVGKRSVLRDTLGTVDLHGLVDDVEGHGGDSVLGDTNLLEGALGLGDVDLAGSGNGDETALVDTGTRDGNVLEDGAVLREHLAERLALGVGDAEEQEVEGTRGNADGAHAVVDTSGAETGLEHLEAAAEVLRTTGNVLNVDLDVVVDDLAVALGGVVVAHDGHGADDLDTGERSVKDDDRVTLVLVGVVGVGNGDDNVDGAAGVTSTRNPLRTGLALAANTAAESRSCDATHPLVAVEDELVALANGGGVAEVGGVRRGDTVLSHREGRADLAVNEAVEELVLLLVRAEASNDLCAHGQSGNIGLRGPAARQKYLLTHVAGVGSRAVHGLGGKVGRVARDLSNETVLECRVSRLFWLSAATAALTHLEVGDTGTRATGEVLELAAREPEVPEAERLGLGLERLKDGGDRGPSLGAVGGELLVPEGLGGDAVLLDERDGLGEELGTLGGDVGGKLAALESVRSFSVFGSGWESAAPTPTSSTSMAAPPTLQFLSTAVLTRAQVPLPK